jgi:hypothetical protein
MSGDIVQNKVIWLAIGAVSLVSVFAALFVIEALLVVPFRLWKEATSDGLQTAKDVDVGKPKRDVSVDEAIAYIAYRKWGKSFFDTVSSSEADGIQEFHEFHQAAYDNHIPIWGIENGTDVHTQIPSDYWHRRKIDWFTVLKGNAKTESTNQPLPSHDENYSSLMTSRRLVEKTWPRDTKSALRFGAPTIEVIKGEDDRQKKVICVLPITNRGPELLRECLANGLIPTFGTHGFERR